MREKALLSNFARFEKNRHLRRRPTVGTEVIRLRKGYGGTSCAVCKRSVNGSYSLTSGKPDPGHL